MDRLRIISFTDGGKPVTLLDINDGVTFTLLRDTLTFTPGERQQQFSQSGQRWGGSKLARETSANATFAADWYVSGGGVGATALENARSLEAQFDSFDGNRYVEWRPEGATRSTYFEIRAGQNSEFAYRWIEFQGTKTLHLKGGWQVAPLGEGERQEVWDDFAINSLSDYTNVNGGTFTINTTSRFLTTTSTATQILVHSGRGNIYIDNGQRLKIKWGTGGLTSAARYGVMLKYLDANNFLFAQLRGDGRISINKVDSGTESEIIGATVGPDAVEASRLYWLSARIAGNVVTAAVHRSTDAAGPVSLYEPAWKSTSTTLAGANATKFGDGVSAQVGIRLNGSNTGEQLSDYRVEPCVYAMGTTFGIQGLVQPKGIALGPVGYGGLGQVSVETYQSYLTDEESGPSYSMAAQAGYHNAGTSTANVTTTAWEGLNSSNMVVPGTLVNEGGSQGTLMSHYSGYTYRARIRVKAVSASVTIKAMLGISTDKADSVPITLTPAAGWKTIEVEWTPTGTFGALKTSSARVAVVTTVQAAVTWLVDTTEIFAPDWQPVFGMLGWSNRPGTSKYFKPDGVTAVDAPVGFFDVKPDVTGTKTAIDAKGSNGSAPGTAVGGWYGDGSTASISTSTLSYMWSEWMVDPSLIESDPLSDDIDLEVWALMRIPSTVISPTMILSAYPGQLAKAGDGSERYTNEWSRSGQLLTTNTGVTGSTTGARFYRLGTLTLPVRPAAPWKIRAYGTWAAGSTGNFQFDHLLILPSRQRAAGPTSKPNDTFYPKFNRGLGGLVKKVRSDLSAAYVTDNSEIATTGLGGAPLIFDPDNSLLDLYYKMATMAPDDPTYQDVIRGADLIGTPNVLVKVSSIPRYPLPRG